MHIGKKCKSHDHLQAQQNCTVMAADTGSAASALWLVVCGPKVLVDSKIVSCSVEESFGQLLLRVEGGRFAETEVHNVNIENGRKGHYVVQQSAPLKLCTQFNCNAVVFNLVGQERPERSGHDSAINLCQ